MDETMNTYDCILAIVGIRFFAKKNWDSKPWLLCQIFIFIISMCSLVMSTTYVITNCSNLLLFIQGSCMWTTGLIMNLSLGICLFFRNNFRTFLTEMAFKDTITDMPLIETVLKMNKGSKLMELKNLVEDSQKKFQQYSRVALMTYQAVGWLIVILYVCSPIYVMIEQQDSSLRLLVHPGLQCTILLLIGQVIRQLRILGFIFLNLNELSMEITVDDPGKWQQCCTAILTQCVQHYIALKKFSNRLNIICRPFYLTVILITNMLVCMCSVKIAISTNKWSLDSMKYYVHGFCFVLVVLAFCLFGQQVQNECTRLENSVMEKWYIFGRSHRKSVIIFHMALSQQMPIYIFGSVTLSSTTFTWFVKTGMSFFTLVMSFFEE